MALEKSTGAALNHLTPPHSDLSAIILEQVKMFSLFNCTHSKPYWPKMLYLFQLQLSFMNWQFNRHVCAAAPGVVLVSRRQSFHSTDLVYLQFWPWAERRDWKNEWWIEVAEMDCFQRMFELVSRVRSFISTSLLFPVVPYRIYSPPVGLYFDISSCTCWIKHFALPSSHITVWRLCFQDNLSVLFVIACLQETDSACFVDYTSCM